MRNQQAAIERDQRRHHDVAFDHAAAVLGIASTLLFAYSWAMQNMAATWAAVGAALAAIASALAAKHYRVRHRSP